MKEREIHIKKLITMQRRVNKSIDDFLKTIFEDFKGAVNQVELIGPGTQIPIS